MNATAHFPATDLSWPRHDWTLDQVEALFALLDPRPMGPKAAEAIGAA